MAYTIRKVKNLSGIVYRCKCARYLAEIIAIFGVGFTLDSAAFCLIWHDIWALFLLIGGYVFVIFCGKLTKKNRLFYCCFYFFLDLRTGVCSKDFGGFFWNPLSN